MTKKLHLLAIDPQVDFAEGGALAVPGATDDMKRLAKMTTRLKDKLDDIHVTLDSHHYVHIAHPIFWKDRAGRNPSPFTVITANDVEAGEWRAAIPSHQARAFNYVKSLAKNGRYALCIWNPHCLIGTAGHNIIPEFGKALLEWEKDFAVVNKVTKGSNVYTEHYSAVQADVPDSSDPTTQLNVGLIQTLLTADEILVAGEASSHCLASTVRDIAANFPDQSTISKLVFLKDASSPVPGFEKLTEDFLRDMTAKGMRVSTTDQYLT